MRRLGVLVSLLLASVVFLVAQRAFAYWEETREGKTVLVLTLEEVQKIEAALSGMKRAIAEREAALESQEREIEKLRGRKDCS